MNISPTEAEEALAVIQVMMKKTRRAISSSGAYIFLIIWGAIWPSIVITALALIGYFLLPGIFYLWMAILGGGGMIALGLYIRSRW